MDQYQVIIIGIYITRDTIYGLKSNLKNYNDNSFNFMRGNGIVENIMDGSIAKATADIRELHGNSIREVARELMSDGIVPDEISIACYGPFSSLNRLKNNDLMTYGQITTDAHAAPFNGLNLKSEFEREFRKIGVPKKVTEKIIIQTDVAAAGLAEWALRLDTTAVCHEVDFVLSREHLVFLSFCGGVGGTVIDESGQIQNGFLHPEMGQISIQTAVADKESKFKSVCPHHTNCLEGYASDDAFLSRFGNSPSCYDEIIDDTNGKAWETHAFYVAQLCAAATLMFSPTMIILSGDVFFEPGFLELVRRAFLERLGGKSDEAFAWYPLLEREDGFLQTTKLAEPGIPGAVCIPIMQFEKGKILTSEARHA